ncbi:hypothetical protein [Salipiger abyssi]|uniref:hypothetical protein n=1 Tax=Salipiger abyssi TaxID=1250539 RepID=UPI004057FE45
MSKDEPPLGPAASDHVAAFMRMGTGLVPFVGSAFAELITQIVPGQRIKRLETYCRYLNQEVQHLGDKELRTKLSEPTRIDLFEEGAYQAIRAITDDRQNSIAKAVAHGIAGSDLDVIEAKRILNLLRQLDDAEIIILCSRLDRYYQDEDFQSRNSEIISPPAAYMGSSRKELDQETVYRIATNNLEQLGLLEAVYRKPKRGEPAEMDFKTGRVRSSHHQVSPAGRLLLRRIGLAEEDDF